MASARARSETTVRPCAPLLDWSRVLANGKPLLADSPDAPASLRKSKAPTPANPVHVWPKELAHVVAEHPGEIYFMHAKVAKPKKKRTWVLLFTNKAYYKLTETMVVKWRLDWTNVHRVEPVDDNLNNKIRLVHRAQQTTASKASSLFKKAPKELVTATMKPRDFAVSTQASRDTMVVLGQRLLADNWQAELERTILREPEIYQAHSFVSKLNRKNLSQLRLLAVSNLRLVNIEPKGGDLTKVKWEVPIHALQHIEEARDSLAFTIHISKTARTAFKAKMKESFTFIAASVAERRDFLAVLQRAFSDKTGSGMSFSVV